MGCKSLNVGWWATNVIIHSSLNFDDFYHMHRFVVFIDNISNKKKQSNLNP